MDAKPITIKLMVDKVTNRVAFAESSRDFVDILLSFLTLPLGSIVRLLDKQSSVGSIDKLYNAVESFDAEYLLFETCRTMLLRPRNAAIQDCKRLRVELEDSESAKYYVCISDTCHSYISYYPNVPCFHPCNKMKDVEMNWCSTPIVEVHTPVFAAASLFLIGDGLDVAPVCDADSFLERLGIKDWLRLEECMVNIGRTEVLHILKRSLLSKTPLSDVLLEKSDRSTDFMELKPSSIKHLPQPAEEMQSEPKKIILKLVVLNNKQLLYAKVNHDFVDLLFSFLTFPLGSVKRHLSRQSALGCVDNLYESAEYLNSVNCLKYGSCKLLNPKLPKHFKCRSQLINIEEEVIYFHSSNHRNNGFDCHCLITGYNGDICPCGNSISECILLMGPEYERKGYSTSLTVYMVSDELAVEPLSFVSCLSIRKGAEGTVEELPIEIGKEEALSLLRSCLTSKTPLTDAFLSKALEAEGKKAAGLVAGSAEQDLWSV